MKKYVSAVALRASLFAAVFVCAASQGALAQTVPSPWMAKDIGAPVLSGSAAHSSGVFTINAAGNDIWNTADQFHFVYQAVSGDVEVVARLESLADVYPWTNAGVMIRSDLTAGAAHGYTASTSANGVYFRRRLSTGATTSSVAGSKNFAPVWLRIARTGSLVTSSTSVDGTSWTIVGSATVAMSGTVYVGLAVSSHDVNTRTTAAISNVKVTTLGLPSGQQGADIGAPVIKGAASYALSNATYTIEAAGTDIWDSSDQFYYVYQPISGDVELIARVDSITKVDVSSKAGVMVRESLAANARHAMMGVLAGKGYAFQRRLEPGAYTEHTSGGRGAPPGWVRLVRTGDLFEAYRSADGTSWTKVGSDTIPMGDTAYVGLAVTSHNTSTATTAVVSNLKISAASAETNQSPAVSITAPSSGVQVTLPTTVTVAATASDPESRMASVDFYAGATLILRDTTAPYSASWAPSAAGTYALTAVAHDADGGSSTSSAVSVSVNTTTNTTATTTAPKTVAFTASSDHSTNVTNYVLKVFASTANPASATPVATSDLGKPTPSSTGEITVERGTFFSGLSTGSYLATVTAVGPGGQTQSASVPFTR